MPTGVFEAVTTVRVEVPLPLTDAGKKAAVELDGNPLTPRFTTPLKLLLVETVTEYELVLPAITDDDEGEADRPNGLSGPDATRNDSRLNCCPAVPPYGCWSNCVPAATPGTSR